MTPALNALLSHEAIIEMVGHEAFARAMVYAKSGRVHDVDVDRDTFTITGRVKGTYRDDYAVSVHLASSRSGVVSAYRSHCSCPIVTDCKHAAAVLIVARHLASAAQLTERPDWEKTLDKLLSGSPSDPGAEVASLALEFGIERIPPFRGYVGRQDLRIRPARRGRSGSWVRSGISWDDLDFVARSYVAEHRELLLQFRAAAGASARYSLPRSAWLSLSTVSTGFWGLLDQAPAAGLAVITAKPLWGPIRSEDPALVGLDARRTPAGVELRPRVSLGEEELDLTTVGVLGEPTHGIFQLTTTADGVEELLLARLDHPLSRELRQLVVDAQPVRVPASDEARFVAEFAPQLRQKLTLRSSDASIALPEPIEPAVQLTVSFESEHRVRLAWAVRYGSGPDAPGYQLDAPADRLGPRDPGAEQRVLTALPLPYEAFPELLALGDPVPPRPAPHVVLDGLAAWVFVEEVLPRLREHGVHVVLEGAVVSYRRSRAEPKVEVSAFPRRDSADWFDLHLKVSVDGETVPFDELFVALTAGEDHLILDGGVYFALDRPQFSQLRDLIEESKALREDDRPELSISRFQASLWDDLVDLGVVIDQSADWARTTRGLIDVTTVDQVDPPITLRADLRPYQLDGYRWLTFLYAHGLGGILADDMGLGKTVQALALVCRAVDREPGGPPFLVVAPTSVVSNWATEAAKFAPDLKIVVLGGSQARRGTTIAEAVVDADLVITSYALLRIDNDALVELHWAGLILDEAQFVKNHRAKTYQCARRINTPFKLAITGTPLENSLMDLWALLSITAPGLFPHPDRFSEYYRRPIERDGDRIRLSQLRRRIRPLMLRRSKESVASELPPKQEQVIEVELHPRHQRIYQTQLQRERQKVLGLIDDLETNRFTILQSLTLLRRLSLDAGLIDPAHDGVPAAKIDLLLADLAELVSEGHQALVFSQFTSFLGRIRARLDEAEISTAYLDGRTRNRDRVVQSFRDQRASVFLISLKAGGFGLNLTEADYCFVLDPWWNPASEAQAVDRTHRIGQTKTVMVYRLVAKDTIEQKVMELKARKEQLFSSVFGDDALAGASLTAGEIRALISG